MLRWLSVLCVALSLTGCHPMRAALAVTPEPAALSCLGAGEVRWARASADIYQRDLDSWCSSVGAPVVALTPNDPSGSVRRLVVLSWNVHVGAGEVRELVATLRAAADDAAQHETGLVLLLQEMFRVGDEIPQWSAHLFKLPGRIAPPQGTPDVETLAHDLGMSVAYVPSMRNGDSLRAQEREDRGSAILSTEPLSDVTAVELPMLKQRRVVVVATVTPRGAQAPPLRVMATHLDTLGPRGAQAEALAAFVRAMPPGPPLVMGGDLNALWGARDQTVRTLSRVMSVEPCGDRSTHWLGRFDYIFSTLPESWPPRTCETLDSKYSSDHRPLLLTLNF